MTDAFTTQTTEDPTVELVGEGKKFKTIADLAKGKLESDAFIEQLKSEMAQLRKDLATRVDNETALNALRDEVKQLKDGKPTAQSSQKTPDAVSASELESLVASYITKTERDRTSAANIVAANNEVVRHYGSLEKAQAAMTAKAAELNLSIQDLKETASKSPTAFLKLILGTETKVDMKSVGGAGSSFNSEGLTRQEAGGPKEGTKEYYDAIRVKSPKLYWSPKIQQEIMKAATNGTYDHWAGVDRS